MTKLNPTPVDPTLFLVAKQNQDLDSTQSAPTNSESSGRDVAILDAFLLYQ